MKPLIVFDVGNVLLGFSLKKAEDNWNRLEPGIGRRISRELWGSALGERLEKGLIGGPACHRLLKKKLGFRMGYAAFRDGFNRIFWPIPANLKLLKRLSKSYPTALLSNTNAVHWRYMLDTYPALRAARWPLASQNLHLMKPDPRIFRAVARRTGISMDRFIYVDDRPDFIRAARRLGIRAYRCANRRSLGPTFRRAGLAF